MNSLMNNIERYKIWAPDGVLWTEWAKPVLFASVTFYEPFDLKIPEVRWLPGFRQDTALIVDLPGESGVEESLALAQCGYRPVPLYNGVYGGYETAIGVRGMAMALYSGAEMLNAMSINSAAPPAFMIDSRRMSGASKAIGLFDNRWCVFPQDMPSAAFLIAQKIKNVIVRADKIQNDISHVLCRYQEAGIKIQHANDNGDIKNITVSRPSQFKSLFYRFRVTMGLSRNAGGGFGSLIPDTQYSDSGGRYYGVG